MNSEDSKDAALTLHPMANHPGSNCSKVPWLFSTKKKTNLSGSESDAKPDGRWIHHDTLWLCQQFANLKMTIEIVDFHGFSQLENGDFP